MPGREEVPEEAVEACRPSTLSDNVLRSILERGAAAIRNLERQRIQEALERAFDELPSVPLATLTGDPSDEGAVFAFDPATLLDTLNPSREMQD